MRQQQLPPNELIAQLKSLTNNPPESLTKNPDLCAKLCYAAQDAMLAFEDSSDPIGRVTVMNVCTAFHIGLAPPTGLKYDYVFLKRARVTNLLTVS